jgi:plasmid maintenance system antidote protein VapI
VAYGDNALKKSSVFDWHKSFKQGRENVKDNERPGQPKTQRSCENVERVRQLVRSNRRLSVRMMAEELNLNRETVRKILTDDLGMRKISAKMVPRILSDEQKQRWLSMSL